MAKDSSIKKRFGSEVRKRRKELKLSLDKLAERCELSTNYVTSIEKGGRDVSISVAHAIAHALGVTVDALLEGESRAELEVVRQIHALPPKSQEALGRFLGSLPRRR